MPVVHDKEQLLGLVNALSERSYADGVLIDIPKARRREQAKNPQKQLRIGLEGDLKVRMATQINRYVEKYGKQLGWDILIQRLEGPLENES